MIAFGQITAAPSLSWDHVELPGSPRDSNKLNNKLHEENFSKLRLWLLGSLLLGWVMTPATGWAQSYLIAHCYQGCPLGTSADNHLIIRPIYALSYNTERKSADWVAYKVSEGSIGIASSLSRQPLPDDFVTDTLEAVDFLDSEASGLIRTRYVPLVDFAGTPYWNEVNYLTNIVARSSRLNQGAWYGLDWAIRNLVNREGDVFVLTGPVYKSEPEVAPLLTEKAHRVPDGFFKIVITQSGQGAAFMFDQSVPVHVHHCELRATVDEIEQATGLRFFPDRIRPIAGPAYTRLGCI